MSSEFKDLKTLVQSYNKFPSCLLVVLSIWCDSWVLEEMHPTFHILCQSVKGVWQQRRKQFWGELSLKLDSSKQVSSSSYSCKTFFSVLNKLQHIIFMKLYIISKRFIHLKIMTIFRQFINFCLVVLAVAGYHHKQMNTHTGNTPHFHLLKEATKNSWLFFFSCTVTITNLRY